MRVVIGFDSDGKPYVISAPKKIEVVFKEPKGKTLKKRFLTFLYRLKTLA